MTYPGIENDPQAPTTNEDILAVEQRRKEREAEYGEYVAVTNIPWGTVLAATPGMSVPTSTVERLKWDELGLVVRRSTKAGREVLEQTGAATTQERERWAVEDKAAADRAKEKAAAAAEKAAADTAAAAAKANAKPATGAKNTTGAEN